MKNEREFAEKWAKKIVERTCGALLLLTRMKKFPNDRVLHTAAKSSFQRCFEYIEDIEGPICDVLEVESIGDVIDMVYGFDSDERFIVNEMIILMWLYEKDNGYDIKNAEICANERALEYLDKIKCDL